MHIACVVVYIYSMLIYMCVCFCFITCITKELSYVKPVRRKGSGTKRTLGATEVPVGSHVFFVYFFHPLMFTYPFVKPRPKEYCYLKSVKVLRVFPHQNRSYRECSKTLFYQFLYRCKGILLLAFYAMCTYT
jgi:hypothetical protein